MCLMLIGHDRTLYYIMKSICYMLYGQEMDTFIPILSTLYTHLCAFDYLIDILYTIFIDCLFFLQNVLILKN